MGKRDGDKFNRNDKDLYPTIDPGCMVPAFVERVKGLKYAEPCWGGGHLERLLSHKAVCKWRSDILPQEPYIPMRDASTLTFDDLKECDIIITNPPYQWPMLKPLLDHLPSVRPTWLLLPGDYMFNVRMAPYMEKCQTVIAIGRMYWLPNKVKGVSNMAWYKFNKWHIGQTEFIGRAFGT